MMVNDGIRAYIDGAGKRAAKAAEITHEMVVKEMGRIGFSDVRKLFNEDGSLIPIHMLDDSTAAAIASVEVDGKPEKDGAYELRH